MDGMMTNVDEEYMEDMMEKVGFSEEEMNEMYNDLFFEDESEEDEEVDNWDDEEFFDDEEEEEEEEEEDSIDEEENEMLAKVEMMAKGGNVAGLESFAREEEFDNEDGGN